MSDTITSDAALHDARAVESTASAMKAKMAASREKGRGGWHTCSNQDLSNMLWEHADKGDPIDVANFAMFHHQLGYPILARTSGVAEIAR